MIPDEVLGREPRKRITLEPSSSDSPSEMELLDNESESRMSTQRNFLIDTSPLDGGRGGGERLDVRTLVSLYIMDGVYGREWIELISTTVLVCPSGDWFQMSVKAARSVLKAPFISRERWSEA